MGSERIRTATPVIERDRPEGRASGGWIGFVRFARRRDVRLAGTVVVAVALASLALSMQGWRSRVPAFDLITYHDGIREFLETGVVLRHGDTGSYGSYKPPGTAWLMLPGVLLLDDPRLTDYVGTGLLHLSTLLGLYLLARRSFGTTCAVLTVVLYGFSQHGLFLAGSLWPNGRPDFYVWTVYLAVLWATRRRPGSLALALLVWGAGMYVDMALLPVLLIFPVLWVLYRPPIRLSPLVAVGAIVLVVWMPYLRFEADRGFIDIRSQVLQQSIHPTDPRAAWCDPTLSLQRWEEGGQTPQGIQPTDEGARPAGFLSRVEERLSAALSNVQGSPVPGGGIVLLLLTVGGLLLASVSGSPAEGVATGKPVPWRSRTVAGSGLMILLGLLLGGALRLADLLDVAIEGTMGVLLHRLEPLLMAGGAAVLGGYVVVALVDRALGRRGLHVRSREDVERTRALVVGLLVPWALLILVAEPGKPERFMWLWTLQSLFLAASVAYFLPRLRVPRALVHGSLVAVVVLVALNPFLSERVEGWARAGWAGEDAAKVRIVDAVAHRIEEDGRDAAAVGYRLFIYPFMAEYHITNPLYKVGAELDLLLRLRHGIANTNRCAEGVAPRDEFLIVETEPEPSEWAPRDYFPVDLPEGAAPLARFGTYELYRLGGPPT